MAKLIQPRVDTGNIYDDVLVNMSQMYEDYSDELGIARIYNEDPQMIDVTPSLAMHFEESPEEARCLGGSRECQTYLARINLVIWYYFEEIVDVIAKKEAAKEIWRVAQVIRTHPTLNGFATAEPMRVLSVNTVVRARASGFYNAGRLLVEVPKRFSVTSDIDVVEPVC